MAGDLNQLVAAAADALQAGDFEGAAAQLTTRLAEVDDPVAHEMLGGIHYAEHRLADSRRSLEAAFRGFRDAGDLRRAARIAADLAELHVTAFGNEAAGRGWVERARRLLAKVGPCVEWGYVDLAYIACARPDVDELQESAERALELAFEFDDRHLEVRALADLGLALVSQGHIAEGLRRLDEAMAIITAGEVSDLSTAGRSFCAMLSSCERTGDLRRAEEWMRLVHELLLGPTAGRPIVLGNHCRVAYGAVLSSAGRWPEAEEVLLEALSTATWETEMHRVESACRLATLRLDQGQVEEAARVLAPYEDRLAACEPLARIHLLQGEPEMAAAVAERGLGEMVGDALRGAGLLAVLVDAELARNDLDAADRAAQRLARIAAEGDSPVVAAQTAMASAKVLVARGATAEASSVLRDAKGRLVAEERPVLAATLRTELAATLDAEGDEAGAIAEARAALAVFDRLGVQPGRDRARAILRRLGVHSRSASAEDADTLLAELTKREREVFDLLRLGLTNAEIAGRLFISAKTTEHHVGRILSKLGVRS
ncbi:MAG TPA: LuxR C-terminal-related transcriptional regulator, partial [Acidimicrobiia bacterium]|nr:LuxR C-terminal-related transcriptional regulator [Acidimicrobiia bacterium]